MARSSCKESLLDAADAVVAESGAAHVTLDAVAEKAGVSKGGLLYHFPTKESLLEGVMRRHLERADAVRAAALEELPPDYARELKAELLAFIEKKHMDPRMGGGMLAAIANEPKLREILLERNRTLFSTLDKQPGHFERKAIAMLATMGLTLLEMLHVSSLNPTQRAAILAEIMRLAEESCRQD